MGLRNTALDPDTFTRAASRFARKREVLDADAIHAVSREIVERLSRSRSIGLEAEMAAVDAGEIEAFCGALMQASPAAALDFIDGRRRQGLTRQGVTG
jgi:MerR family transcriptional regulator, light-induced transcriptional regulator